MRHLELIDRVTQGYLLCVAGLMFVFHGDRFPGWPWLIAGHVLAVVAISLLVGAYRRKAANPLLVALRHFYPLLLYTAFYCETGWLNQLVFVGYWDPFFYRWEGALFGTQPSLVWMVRAPNPVLSEVLHAAYFSYYLMIPGVALALFLKDRSQYWHYVTVLSVLMYTCYLIYILVPVIGPRIFGDSVYAPYWPAASASERAWIQGARFYPGPFHALLEFIYRVFEKPGAAFPSSHVAAAVVTAYFSWIYLPRIRLWHAGAVLLLSIATIYCRFHYAVDVLAAIVTAAILIPSANWLYHRWTGQEKAPTGDCVGS